MTGTHIGIVACSPPGAALCFETICQIAIRHDQAFEVSVHAHDFARYMRFVDVEDWDGVAELMLSSAERLARIGADVLVAPCNTIHAAFARVAPRSPRPWLHIAEEVALAAKRSGVRRLGLLGTKSTMEGALYADRLVAMGVAFQVPERAERIEINRIIFEELVKGTATPEAREFFRAQVEALAAKGCDAVGLCCTELPLVLNAENSALPLLDSTRLLARAAVEKCLVLRAPQIAAVQP